MQLCSQMKRANTSTMRVMHYNWFHIIALINGKYIFSIYNYALPGLCWSIVAICSIDINAENRDFLFFIFFILFFYNFIVPHSYMAPVRGLAPGGLCLNITFYSIVIQGRIGYMKERAWEREEKKKRIVRDKICWQ